MLTAFLHIYTPLNNIQPETLPMIKRSPFVRITSCVIAVCLATSGARTATAQEAPSVAVQQMQEQMRLMEQRLQQAEQRASRAEAMAMDMQKQMHGHQLRAQEQAKKDAPKTAQDESSPEIATTS